MSRFTAIAALFLLPLAACGGAEATDDGWLAWSSDRPYQVIATDPRGNWVVIREEEAGYEQDGVLDAEGPDERPMHLLRHGQDPTTIQGYIDATKDGDRIAVIQGQKLRLVETRTETVLTLFSAPMGRTVWADGNWVGHFADDDQILLFAAPCEGGCRLGLADPRSGDHRVVEPVVEQFSDAAVAGSGRYVVTEVACLRPGDPRRGRQLRVGAPRSLTSSRAPFRTCIVPAHGYLLVAEKDESILLEVADLVGVCDAGLVVRDAAGDLALRRRGADPVRFVARGSEAEVLGLRPDAAVVAWHRAGEHAGWIVVHRPVGATRVHAVGSMEVAGGGDTLVRSSSGWIHIGYPEGDLLYVDPTDAVVRRARHRIVGAYDHRHILLREESRWFVWNRLHDSVPRPLPLPADVRHASKGRWVAVDGVTVDVTEPNRTYSYEGHAMAASEDGRVLVTDELDPSGGLPRFWFARGSMRWVRPR